MTSLLDQQLPTEMKGDRMPGWNGRQGGRHALLWCGPLVLGSVLCGQAKAADAPAGPDGALIVLPHMIRDPQFAEVILPAPAAAPTDSSWKQADASTRTSRGRVLMDERIKVVKRPTSSKAARKAALVALPLAKMTEDNRRRVQQIANPNCLFRELPTFQFQVDPRVYHFFMNHPDVAVSIWRVMQISEFQMHQTSRDTFETDDGAGTSGAIGVAYRSDNEAVIFCDGVYKSSLLPSAIKANGVLHVQVGFDRRPDGKMIATHTARLFVTFPSQTVDTAARIMSPISNAIIDQNFREVSLFLHMMSVAMQRQPGWVENVSSQLDGILEVRKTQLMEVTVEVFADANPNLKHMPRRSIAGDGDEHDRTVPPRPSRTALRDDVEPSSLPDRPATLRE